MAKNSVPNDDPILLDAKLIGRQINPLESFVPHLSDHELRQAINFSGFIAKRLKLKNLESFKVESWKTKIEPPRDVPLIGRAQLHRTFFTCLIQFVDGDGIERERTIIVEKNQFEVLVPEDLLWRP